VRVRLGLVSRKAKVTVDEARRQRGILCEERAEARQPRLVRVKVRVRDRVKVRVRDRVRVRVGLGLRLGLGLGLG
jgi:hypothetical protein